MNIAQTTDLPPATLGGPPVTVSAGGRRGESGGPPRRHDVPNVNQVDYLRTRRRRKERYTETETVVWNPERSHWTVLWGTRASSEGLWWICNFTPAGGVSGPRWPVLCSNIHTSMSTLNRSTLSALVDSWSVLILRCVCVSFQTKYSVVH